MSISFSKDEDAQVMHMTRNIFGTRICICVLLLFIIRGYGVYAQNFLPLSYSSDEARLRMLELLAEGKLSKPNMSIEVIQTSNWQPFLISTTQTPKGLMIKLAPKIDSKYTFPSISSWSFLLDRTGKLVEVIYYFQKDGQHRIKARSYLNATEFTLQIRETLVYENIAIPMSLRAFISMPFLEFLEESYQALKWDWVFPSKRIFSINERSRNLVAYINAQSKRDGMRQPIFTMEDFDSFITTHNYSYLEKKQEKAQIVIKMTSYVQYVINLILKYSSFDEISESQFTPFDDESNPIPLYHEDYLKYYMNEILTFLQLYPDFHTSINTIQHPFQLKEREDLSSFYSHIYMMTAKYPGIWYLLPIQIQVNNVKMYVSLDLLLPYFTPDGAFHVFGMENIDALLQLELNNLFLQRQFASSKFLKYFYEIGVLRVPSTKRSKTLE